MEAEKAALPLMPRPCDYDRRCAIACRKRKDRAAYFGPTGHVVRING